MTTKTRFSTTDVQAMCRDLRSTLMGHKIANIYDIDDKTYLFKFASTSASQPSVISSTSNGGTNQNNNTSSTLDNSTEKSMLLIESGIRFHTTKYLREKNEMPSPFTMKLRKYIRNKKLDYIQQLSNDRVVDMKFGHAETANHIILELYANGNIILTDSNHEILALLRSHQFEEDIAVKVGEIYPLKFTTMVSYLSTIPSIKTTETNNGEAAVIEASSGDDNIVLHSSVSDSVSRAVAMTKPVYQMTAEEFIEWGRVKERARHDFSSNQLFGTLANTSLVTSGVITTSTVSAATTSAENDTATNKMPTTNNEKGSKQKANNNKDNSTSKSKDINDSNNNNNTVATSTVTPSAVTSKVKKTNLKQLLLSKESGVSNLGVEIIEHCILSANLSPTQKVDEILKADTPEHTVFLSNYESLLRELQAGQQLVDKLNIPGQPGYILWKPMITSASTATVTTTASKSKSSSTSTGASLTATALMDPTTTATTTATVSEVNKEYLEYVPFFLKQHSTQNYLLFNSFDEAVDEYYFKLDDQKVIKKAFQIENTQLKKIEKLKFENSKKIKTLQEQSENFELNANLIEFYNMDITKVLLVINSSLENGLDWSDIEAMVDNEKKSLNPIAMLIHKLKLQKNKIILRLKNVFFDEDDDDDDGDSSSSDDSGSNNNDNTQQIKHNKANKVAVGSERKSSEYVDVEIDITLSAHANARNMFVNRKSVKSKELKTIEFSSKALQAVETQVSKTLNQTKIVSNLKSIRKIHWFEKFNWFVSSEGYLVLSGRDAQQNEMLVKKYMRTQDIYVHANLNGASTCIVRNKSLTGAVSPLALQEAGTVAVCRSVAWTNKTLTSAWWVHASQVSKAPPSGEFLSTGSFMIYGKKNFLPPSVLEMGFGVMFRLDDSCVAAHVSERRDRIQVSENDELESVYSEAYDRYGINMDSVTGSTGVTDASGGSEDHLGAVSGGDSTCELSGSIDENTTISKKAMNLQRKAHLANKSGPRITSTSQSNSYSTNTISSNAVGTSGIIQSVIAEEDEQNDDGPADSNSDNNDKDEEGDDDEDDQPIALVKPTKGTKQQQQQQQQQLNNNSNNNKQPKKKKLDKKKSRRYAEQDEEDKILALSLLGHSSVTLLSSATGAAAGADCGDSDSSTLKAAAGASGGGVTKRVIMLSSNQDKQNQLKQQQKEKSLQQKQLKAGIHASTGNSAELWLEQLRVFPESVRLRFSELMSARYCPSTHSVYDERTKAFTRLNLTTNSDNTTPSGSGSNDAANASSCGPTSHTTQQPQTETVSEAVADHSSSSFAFLKPNEIDSYELTSLASFHSEQHMLEILRLFELGFIEKKGRISNKSGFLAGIMKRFQKDLLAGKEVMSTNSNAANTNNNANAISVTTTATVAATASTQVDCANPATDHEPNNNNNNNNNNDSNDKNTAACENNDNEDHEDHDQHEEDQDECAATAEASLDDIDKLTGCPLPSDTLLYAVPVVGPFHTLQRYKYRVKLTPGTGKKGKVCKQALEVFLAQSIQNFNSSINSSGGSELTAHALNHYSSLSGSAASATAAATTTATFTVSNNKSFPTQNIENLLMKGLTDTEMVAIMMPEVKISTPGLQQLKAKAKKVQRGQKANK